MKTYKRIALSIALTALCLTGFVACKSTLEPGGAYTSSVTNTVGTNIAISTQADKALYLSDASFDLAYQTVNFAFTTEYNNRAYFQSISPAIKESLDKIRPEAVKVRNAYIRARQAYIANPTAGNWSTLQSALTNLQSLLNAANAAIATFPKP